jgi:hypothetical protein
VRDLGLRLQDRAGRLWRWFFPERVELPAEVARLVRTVYPTLDLGAVRFYRGLPHLTRLLGSEAVNIPAPFAPRTCVYVDPAHYDTGSVEGIGTLLHEAYHALQTQEAGWGLGPFRPFLVLYFAAGAANRFQYEGHPMEEVAYRLAGCHRSRFESAFPDWEGDLAALEEHCRDLAMPASGLRFWPDLARSVPFVRRLVGEGPIPPAVAALLLPLPVAVWLVTWSLASALAWLGWLLVAGVGAGVAAVLWSAGLLLSSMAALFATIRGE